MSEIACEESSTELPATSPYAAWLRIMAVLYDPFLWLGEIAGMRRRRRTLVAELWARRRNRCWHRAERRALHRRG